MKKLSFITSLTLVFWFLVVYPATADGWYDYLWPSRKAITIDYTKVSGSANLTNFPVLISLTDTDLRDDAQNDADDILFTAADGTSKLDHEIEKFDGATGELVAWVEVPTVSYTTDTVIYLYYGYADATNQQNATGTWNSNYASIWHLGEDPSGTSPQSLDSTSNNNDGTSEGSMDSGDSVSGKIGKAVDYDGSNARTRITDNNSIEPASQVTFSAWIYNHAAVGWSKIISRDYKGDGSWNSPYVTYSLSARHGTLNAPYLDITTSGSNTKHTATTVLQNNIWYYVAGTWNGSVMKVYINGTAENGQTNKSGSLDYTYTSDVTIGNRSPYTPGEGVNAILDEVRILNTALSGDWLTTEYNNQNSPATFFSTGGEETGATPTPAPPTPTPGPRENIHDFTLAVWASPSASLTSKAIVVKNNEVRLVTDASGKPLCQIHDGTDWLTAATSSAALSLNTWQHLACTYGTDGVLRILFNGTQTGYQSLNANNANTANVWRVLSDASSTYSDFSGTVDDLRIYNRALTSGEISSILSYSKEPIAYYKYDEGTGSSLIDYSGNGYTGTWHGNGRHWVNGKFGQAGSFGGNSTNDYVTSAIPFNSSFTYSTWIYSLENGREQHIMEWNCTQFYKGWNGNKIGTASWSDLNGNTTIPTNTWTHVALTRDSSGISIYVNGILDGATDGDGGDACNNNFYISSYSDDGSYFFNGYIDETKVYDYVRTPQQIIEDMNAGHPAPGSPVGSSIIHWKFNEGADNTCLGGVNDVCNSGSGGATYDGSNSSINWSNSGKFGKAISLNSQGDYVNAGDVSFVDGLTGMTVGLWVNPSAVASARSLLCKRNFDTQESFCLSLSSSDEVQFQVATALNDYESFTTSSVDLPTNQWSHIVAVFDGTQEISNRLKIFINGLQKPGSLSGTPPTSMTSGSTSTLQLGKNTDFTYGAVTGLYDDVQIFTSALTPDQIKLLYNQGQATVMGALSTTSTGAASNAAADAYCPPGQGTACTAPVGEWKMDENSGTSTNDSSGNGITGTLTNTASWATGKYGNAVSLDGNETGLGTHVSLANDSLDGYSEGTISVWFKLDDTGDDWQDLFSSSDALGMGKRLEVAYERSTNRVHFWTRACDGGTDLQAYTSLSGTQTNWHHVTWTQSSTAHSMFIDGVKAILSYSSGNSSTNCFIDDLDTSTTYYNIGAVEAVGGGTYMNELYEGLIDDVKIYNYARTPAQIAWDYNRGAPIAWYKFNECSGTVANNLAPKADDRAAATYTGTIYPGDASGDNDEVGTCTSGDTTDMWYDGATGKHNASLGFDGTNDYVGITGGPTLGDQGTISFWVNPTDLTGDTEQSIFANSAGEGFEKAYGSQNWVWTIYGNTILTNVTLIQGEWQSVTLIWDNSHPTPTMRRQVYINGKLKYSSTENNSSTETLTKIATRNGLGRYFNGLIDEFKVFNYALTAEQVKLDYNQGAVSFGP